MGYLQPQFFIVDNGEWKYDVLQNVIRRFIHFCIGGKTIYDPRIQ